MKRRFIHRLSAALESNGIRIFKENSSDLIVWRLVLSMLFLGSCLVSLFIFSVQNRENFIKILNPLIAFSTVALFFGGVLVLFLHRKIISQMLHQMDDHIYMYNDELNVQYKWYLREENFETLMSAVWRFHYFLIAFVFSPSIAELIFFGEITHYAYPCWTPWSRKDTKMQVFTLVLQLSQAFIASRFNYLILTITFMGVFEYLRQYERLKIAVSNLKQKSHYMEGNKETIKIQENLINERIRRNIVECIKHHQFLQQNFVLFKTWFQMFFSLQLTSTMFSFSLGFYVVFKAPTEQVFLYLTTTLLTATNILCLCFIGEIFSDLNDGIKNLIFFETQFWEMNAENRRLFGTFHFLLNQPFYLCGFSIFGASLTMFGNIIRKTYSIFNVLNISLNK